MKKSLSFLMGLLLPFVVIAGTNTVSYQELYGVKTCQFSWNNGNATGTNDLACVVTSKPMAGVVERVTFMSSLGSNATFTATLKDADGADLMGGWGTVPTQAVGATYTFCPGYPLSAWGVTTNIKPWAFNSALTLTVTNIASTTNLKTGAMKLYYRE